jgi:hypothetical protein
MCGITQITEPEQQGYNNYREQLAFHDRSPNLKLKVVSRSNGADRKSRTGLKSCQ